MIHLVSGHDEPRAGFYREPRLAEALVVQLLDELELNRNLSGVGHRQDSTRRLDEPDRLEVKLSCLNGHLQFKNDF